MLTAPKRDIGSLMVTIAQDITSVRRRIACFDFSRGNSKVKE